MTCLNFSLLKGRLCYDCVVSSLKRYKVLLKKWPWVACRLYSLLGVPTSVWQLSNCDNMSYLLFHIHAQQRRTGRGSLTENESKQACMMCMSFCSPSFLGCCVEGWQNWGRDQDLNPQCCSLCLCTFSVLSYKEDPQDFVLTLPSRVRCITPVQSFILIA